MFYPKELLPNKKERRKTLALAKDVLLQLIPNKHFRILQGVYLGVSGSDPEYYNSEQTGELCKKVLKQDSAKKLFKTFLKEEKVPELLAKVKCNVCALGSLLVANVIKNNKLSISSIQRENNGIDDFRYTLGNLNAMLIEHAFEGWTTGIGDPTDTLVHYASNHFRNFNGTTARGRLKSICQNIVRNNGVFVPQGVKLRSEHKTI